MIKISICDDNPEQLAYSKNLIGNRKDDDFIINTYTEARDLLYDICNGKAYPDIIIMDIRFEHDDGIDIIQKIQKYNNCIQVIYVTGYTDYIEKAYETEHCYYLVKPITEGKMQLAVDKALDLIRRSKDEIITFSNKTDTLRLKKNDILYLESRKRIVHIFMTHTEEEVYGKLSDFESQAGKALCRCHKSFLVNIEKISRIDSKEVTLFGGKVIPVSRTYMNDFKECFNNYIGR